MKAEHQGNEGFQQGDSVEHKGDAEAQSTDRREGKERDGVSDLLEAILDRDNLNRAYKRVRRNYGAAGIDGMTVEEALPWLKEYAEEGYRYAVSVDLSKYFDTLNHERLMNLLHKQIQDMRVLRLIKKYLKSGVMGNGVVCKNRGRFAAGRTIVSFAGKYQPQ